jgi:hypothetical protein
MHDLVDAAVREARRLGDLSLRNAQRGCLSDQMVPSVDQVFALCVYAADLVSYLAKVMQRALAGHPFSSELCASLVAMTTSVLAEPRHSKSADCLRGRTAAYRIDKGSNVAPAQGSRSANLSPMQQIQSRRIREAVEENSYASAFEQAHAIERFDLADALEVVLTTAETDRILYDAMAVRWIVMAVEARRLTLHEVEWAATRFREHVEAHRDSADALRKLLN